MFIYYCKKCKIEKKLEKAILKIIDSRVQTANSECPKCNEFMVEVEKEFGGFPMLIRTEPTLKKN
mgnify:FL=1